MWNQFSWYHIYIRVTAAICIYLYKCLIIDKKICNACKFSKCMKFYWQKRLVAIRKYTFLPYFFEGFSLLFEFQTHRKTIGLLLLFFVVVFIFTLRFKDSFRWFWIVKCYIHVVYKPTLFQDGSRTRVQFTVTLPKPIWSKPTELWFF